VARSKEAVTYGQENGMNMMFLEPVKSFHALHRWVKKLTGTYAEYLPSWTNFINLLYES
jgi:hypothetical protein